VTNRRETYANSLLRVARAQIDNVGRGARDAVSFSLSVFGSRDGRARDSAGAFSCFMFYFNQLIHGETGALDEGSSFVVGVRQAVTENMSLALTLSVNEVGR
jgi:hypothetical protein